MLTLLLPHPAALIKTAKTKTLVIADPHIGWENALQERGIHVPSQTPKLLKKLVSLLLEHKPDALVIIGDVKYTVIKAELGEWHDIPDFFTELQRHVADISIIRGNHDANLEPLLPEAVKLLPATGRSDRRYRAISRAQVAFANAIEMQNARDGARSSRRGFPRPLRLQDNTSGVGKSPSQHSSTVHDDSPTAKSESRKRP